MIKKIYLSLIFIFISSLLFSQVIQKVGSNGFIDWTEGTVIAKGTALGKADEDNPVKKKLQAKYAAKSVAFRNLAETINGVHITSKTIVKNFVTENDEIRLKVESFIRGAVEREVKYLPDGSCEVTIEAPLNGEDGFTQVFLSNYKGPEVIDMNPVVPIEEKKEIRPAPGDVSRKQGENIFEQAVEKTPSPFIEKEPIVKEEKEKTEIEQKEVSKEKEPEKIETKAEVKSEPEVMNVTGVVVDVRGEKMTYSIFPQIFDENGKPVYTLAVTKSAMEKGMASYVDDVEKGKNHERVKITPLFVKAKKVEGSTVFISTEDAEKLKKYNKETGILDNCKVVFIVTE